MKVPECIYKRHVHSGTYESQTRALDPLELKSRAVRNQIRAYANLVLITLEPSFQAPTPSTFNTLA